MHSFTGEIFYSERLKLQCDLFWFVDVKYTLKTGVLVVLKCYNKLSLDFSESRILCLWFQHKILDCFVEAYKQWFPTVGCCLSRGSLALELHPLGHKDYVRTVNFREEQIQQTYIRREKNSITRNNITRGWSMKATAETSVRKYIGLYKFKTHWIKLNWIMQMWTTFNI
jgi:hypothetical protein